MVSILASAAAHAEALPPPTDATPAETRTSEATVSLDQAWHESGFRMEVLMGYEALPSWKHVPRGAGIHVGVGSGWQLNTAWSLDVAMTYLLFLGGGSIAGIRWSGAAGPTWHPWEGLRMGVQVGFANMLTNWDIDPSVYQPHAGFCDGPTAEGLAFVGYLFPLAESFAMGPRLQAALQYTKCADIDTTGVPQSVPPWPGYELAVVWALSGR